MAEFRSIHSKMWRDSWFTELSAIGKLLFIYIKTTSSRHSMRVYNVPIKLVSVETGIDEEKVKELLDTFSLEGKIPTREQYTESRRINSENKNRSSQEYIEWRASVFERDNYACRNCGSRCELVAHHIMSWVRYEKARFDINNGLTMCKSCHKELHRKRKK